MRVVRESDAAYSAGLVDGEGTFLFYKQNVKRHGNKVYFIIRPHVDVAMTSEPVLRWLGEMWGGLVIPEQRRLRKPHHKPVWRWTISRNEDLIVFLRAILPYMRVRQEAAARLLEFAVSRQGVRSRPKREQAYTARERALAGVVEMTRGRECAG